MSTLPSQQGQQVLGSMPTETNLFADFILLFPE